MKWSVPHWYLPTQPKCRKFVSPRPRCCLLFLFGRQEYILFRGTNLTNFHWKSLKTDLKINSSQVPGLKFTTIMYLAQKFCIKGGCVVLVLRAPIIWNLQTFLIFYLKQLGITPPSKFQREWLEHQKVFANEDHTPIRGRVFRVFRSRSRFFLLLPNKFYCILVSGKLFINIYDVSIMMLIWMYVLQKILKRKNSVSKFPHYQYLYKNNFLTTDIVKNKTTNYICKRKFIPS